MACCFSVRWRESAIRFMPTGSPVSGSRAVSSPVLMLKIASGVITYFRLATGRGRRNTEIVGLRLFNP